MIPVRSCWFLEKPSQRSRRSRRGSHCAVPCAEKVDGKSLIVHPKLCQQMRYVSLVMWVLSLRRLQCLHVELKVLHSLWRMQRMKLRSPVQRGCLHDRSASISRVLGVTALMHSAGYFTSRPCQLTSIHRLSGSCHWLRCSNQPLLTMQPGKQTFDFFLPRLRRHHPDKNGEKTGPLIPT